MKRYRHEKRLVDLLVQDAERAADRRSAMDRVPKLAADKMYRVDPNYSRIPYAVCENVFLGLPCCKNGIGRYCYCRIPCGRQYALGATQYGDPYVSAEAERLSKLEIHDAVEHAREIMRTQRPEMELPISIDDMVAMILGDYDWSELEDPGRRKRYQDDV